MQARSVLIAGICVSLLYPTITNATARPATAADLPLMRWAGIANPTVGMMWNPADPNTGQAAAETKQWLAQRATRNSNISCMTTDFAQKLKKFMEAVPGGPPKITDGYRSPQAQANLPAGSTRAGPCQSYHNYGLAADFNEANKQALAWMRANAGAYGLRTIGAWDPGHFQIAQPLPPRNMCGQCTGGADGMLAGAPGGTTPTQQLMSNLQQMLKPQQQQRPQTPPTSAPASSNPSNAYVPQTIPPNPTNTVTPPKPTSPAVSDLIGALADPSKPKATPTPDGVTVALNQNLTNTATIAPTPASTPEPTVPYRPNPDLVPTTFTSDDLSNSPRQAYAQKPADTFALQVLENLKQTLLTVLSYLRPFRTSGLQMQYDVNAVME